MNGGGIGFIGVLAITFIVLKLTGVIGWPWVWVLAPIWLGLVLYVVVAVIVFVFIQRFFRDDR